MITGECRILVDGVDGMDGISITAVWFVIDVKRPFSSYYLGDRTYSVLT